ncbi:hypothetical protein TNCV_3007691 [Trichonephila clavipes]|nr:hypothetical protein TNCV_3007691 [Trichonephila clavipes]
MYPPSEWWVFEGEKRGRRKTRATKNEGDEKRGRRQRDRLRFTDLRGGVYPIRCEIQGTTNSSAPGFGVMGFRIKRDAPEFSAEALSPNYSTQT